MTTISALLGRWTIRDKRYGERRTLGVRTPLSDDEITLVRAFRQYEISDLAEADQRLWKLTLDRWTPPPIAR